MLGSGIAMWQICCRIVASLSQLVASVAGVRVLRVVEFGSYRASIALRPHASIAGGTIMDTYLLLLDGWQGRTGRAVLPTYA